MVSIHTGFAEALLARLVASVFLMACLPAEAGGQGLDARNAAVEAVEAEARATDPAPGEGAPTTAGGASGSGHVPLNRRTFLRPHPERDTLTNRYIGLGRELSEAGIESTRNLWALYQGSIAGGIESDSGSSGFYFFANHVDLDKLIGLDGASMFARADGSWGDGINEAARWCPSTP